MSARKSCTLLEICVLAAFGLQTTISVNAQSSRPGMGSTPYADASGTGVTFRVWAPNATTVAVPGSFNGWNTTANFLVKEGSSGIWSGDIPSARSTAQYKYHINGSVWKRDPRGRQVVHSSDNTIVYDPKAFNWMGDTRQNVNSSDLVIYEMHVGAFYDPTPSSGGPGKFTDAIAKLDYLVGLGINAVELMPLTEFAGDYSWGYNMGDLYAVENAGYGGPDGLKNFVKAAHQRGIRVLLDVVHNHYGPSDLDLWGFDNGTTPGIYLYSASGLCCTPWGSRPNYSSEGVRSFIIDSFRLWMDEYHIDGFRWDAVGAMRHYDPGYVSIPEADSLIQYINSTIIHADHPGVISIAEDDASGMGFDGQWNHSFGGTLINEVVKVADSSRDMTALFNAMNGSGFFRVLFAETHDLVGDLNGAANQRLPTRIQPGDPDGYFARKRSLLAAAVVLSTPGIPMLFMGQEMLEDEQFADSNPLDWSHTTSYPGVVNFYRDMIHLRRNLDGVSLGMTGPNLAWHAVDNGTKLLAFHRWGAGPDDQVMVVLNFSNNEIGSYQLNFPADGTWYVNLNSDWTTYSPDFGNKGSSLVQVSGGNGQIGVGPYGVLVLSRRALPRLDSDGDGLLNGWEELHFGNPISGIATADDDLDGTNNLQEQAADTNPHSADSVLKFTAIQVENGDVLLSWKGGESVRQIIKRAVQVDGIWTAIYTNLAPTAISNSITIPGPISASSFFRIETAQN